MIARLKCSILPGLWSDERVARVETVHGVRQVVVHTSSVDEVSSTCACTIVDDGEHECVVDVQGWCLEPARLTVQKSKVVR